MTKKSKIQAETRKSNRAEREDKFDATIAQFEADIEEAEKIENPADKILKLDEIRRKILIVEGIISDAVTGEAKDIASEAKRAANKAFWILSPTLIGAIIAEDKRLESVTKKLEAEAKDHLQKIGEQQDRMVGQRKFIGKLINTAAENSVEISQSPSCEQVLKVYGVTPIFAKASAKQIVVYAAQLAEAASAQEEAAGRKRPQASGIRLIRPNA